MGDNFTVPASIVVLVLINAKTHWEAIILRTKSTITKVFGLDERADWTVTS